ncbi:hypothetical protein COB55_03270 [Candidatus Wolfebacteria bacterium]|nr:MAG: hypothetical protein COB55_03270 [Candidatus Wolfebacteria bacterium]
MMSYRVILPMPPAELRPNKQLKWQIKAPITKRFRFLAYVAFRKDIPDLMDREFIPFTQVKIERRFFFRKNARRDKANFNAGTKAIDDGMVDSGLIVDDSGDNIIWLDSSLIVDKAIAEDYLEYLIEAA